MSGIKQGTRPFRFAHALAMFALLVFGGVLIYRRAGGRRAPARRDRLEPDPSLGTASCRCGELAQQARNRLGAIRGYCELAKMKGENGEALAGRMDAAIETVTEVSALLRQLVAACRR